MVRPKRPRAQCAQILTKTPRKRQPCNRWSCDRRKKTEDQPSAPVEEQPASSYAQVDAAPVQKASIELEELLGGQAPIAEVDNGSADKSSETGTDSDQSLDSADDA